MGDWLEEGGSVLEGVNRFRTTTKRESLKRGSIFEQDFLAEANIVLLNNLNENQETMMKKDSSQSKNTLQRERRDLSDQKDSNSKNNQFQKHNNNNHHQHIKESQDETLTDINECNNMNSCK
eukprot:CAMPEP_0116890160 /NCGR_PEP_ID=MMETSP0467-20121206/699_1 /TAXON_ID=283647 /ORGANISM="Mesodinium pulex, Strain SPMC105" /LENGTH=121 /DNA_ID=CAMNT_0004557643 /DNA_START=576 /DNA_END=941 /DNA_ORIENTATION=-